MTNPAQGRALADLWADSAERLTPPEQWTDSAKAVVLLRWHGEHRGYLSHEEAERVLAEAYRHPMPTITFAELCRSAAVHARAEELAAQRDRKVTMADIPSEAT